MGKENHNMQYFLDIVHHKKALILALQQLSDIAVINPFINEEIETQ